MRGNATCTLLLTGLVSRTHAYSWHAFKWSFILQKFSPAIKAGCQTLSVHSKTVQPPRGEPHTLLHRRVLSKMHRQGLSVHLHGTDNPIHRHGWLFLRCCSLLGAS